MSQHPAYVASTAELLTVASQIFEHWQDIGVTGQFMARNIDTGAELGFDVETPVPLASVVKVPLALVVLDQICAGELDAAMPVTLDPATKSTGPTGIAPFRYAATIAVADLLHPMLTVSDNASADALFDLVGADTVEKRLRDWKCAGIRVRHRLNRLYECAAGVAGDDFDLALRLAIQEEVTGRRTIDVLDPAHANTGTAAALVELLQRIWLDDIAHPDATAELRRLMAMQVFTQRLSSDLRADTIRISGKTGTFLHLRHEIGVVAASSGDRVAIAALTRSDRQASIAQDIDLSIGAAGRSAFEALRG
jgi:beta-lactamase class A